MNLSTLTILWNVQCYTHHVESTLTFSKKLSSGHSLSSTKKCHTFENMVLMGR